MRVDIWSDVACPWCWIGVTRFERVLAEFAHAEQVDVSLHSYQLDPGLPPHFDGTEAEYLAARKGLPASAMGQIFDRVVDAAASEQLTMNYDVLKVANTRRAHRLLHSAQQAGGDIALVLKQKLFGAHFADGESIWDADMLTRLATESGLDEQTARAALDDESLDQAVQADIDQAAALGISGVPFFVFAEKYGVSGAQPAEVFESALTQVWDELHPSTPTLQPINVGGSGDACGPEGCD